MGFKAVTAKVKGLKQLRNRRVLLTLYLSFVAMLLFPILLLSIIMNTSLFAAVEQEQNQANLNVLKQSREILDYNFQYINSMAYQLSLSPALLSFAQNRSTNENQRVIQIKEIVNEMSIYNVSKDILYLTAVYVKNQDVIITPFTAYTSEEFYGKISKYETMSYDEWHTALNAISYQTFWPSQTINAGTTSVKEITTIITPLPLGYSNSPLSFLSYIDTSMVIDIFSNSFSGKEGEIIISDSRNNTLISSTEKETSFKALEDSLEGENGVFGVELENERYIGVYDSSRVVNLKYVYLIPKTVFDGISNYIRKIFTVMVVVCLVVGAIMVWIFSSRNYKPLNSIMDVISRNKLGVEGINEYETIQSSFKQIISQYTLLENKVDFQMMQLVHNFLIRLLRVSGITDEECSMYLARYSLNLNKELLTAIVIGIDSYSDFSPEESMADKRSAIFAIMNIIQDVFSENYSVYTVEMEDTVSVITGFSSEQKDLYDKLLYAKNVLGNGLGIYVSIGIGSFCTRPSMLYTSYSTAMRALNHGRVTTLNDIAVYDDIDIPNQLFFYPVDREMQLINSLKNGNETQALRVIEEVYRENFVDSTISSTMIECLFHNICASLMKALSDMNMGQSAYYSLCSQLIQEIDGSSPETFIKNCTELICSISQSIISNRQQSKDSLIVDVQDFISQNYHLHNLSLEYTADNFHLTYTYLSKIFKDNTGYNFIDYLNRYRLDRSKEILKTTDISIQEASAMVGYSSSNTYIRIFKKYNGITPGQFRAAEAKNKS